MKNAIRNIAIYLLTAIVVVASTGFSVCCMFGCHDEKVVSGEIGCCEKRMAEEPVNDCPDCHSEYISLDADFLLNSSDFKINLPQATVLQAVIFLHKNRIPKKTIAPLGHDLPPPPYGKDLLPLILSFLC